jgi:hypothetical protein
MSIRVTSWVDHHCRATFSANSDGLFGVGELFPNVGSGWVDQRHSKLSIGDAFGAR